MLRLVTECPSTLTSHCNHLSPLVPAAPTNAFLSTPFYPHELFASHLGHILRDPSLLEHLAGATCQSLNALPRAHSGLSLRVQTRAAG